MRTLLGHLAHFASLSSQSEVLCTQGLAYFLQHPNAKTHFAKWLSSLSKFEVSEHLNWYAEAHQEADRGRPDVEARLESKGVVKVEAKLGAAFSDNQFRSYVRDLGRVGSGVLLVLVPRYRLEEATKAVSKLFGLSGTGPWRLTGYANVAILVVSWDEVVRALHKVRSESFRGELEQFEHMYKVLSNDDIEPLASHKELIRWREREADFVKLVDRVTRRLTKSDQIYPMGVEPLEQDAEGLLPKGYQRRYVCMPLEGAEPCFSIGVRDPFAGSPTPIWMRFDASTPRYALISDRLNRSPIKFIESGGGLWIPLDLPLGTDSREMENILISRANEVIRVACGQLRSMGSGRKSKVDVAPRSEAGRTGVRASSVRPRA